MDDNVNYKDGSSFAKAMKGKQNEAQSQFAKNKTKNKTKKNKKKQQKKQQKQKKTKKNNLPNSQNLFLIFIISLFSRTSLNTTLPFLAFCAKSDVKSLTVLTLSVCSDKRTRPSKKGGFKLCTISVILCSSSLSNSVWTSAMMATLYNENNRNK